MKSHARTRTLRVYERGTGEYLAEWGRRRYRVPALLRALLTNVPSNATILDLGCGPAQDTRYLEQRGYRAVGVDGNQSFLTWARAKSPRTRLVQADVRRLPLAPERFDAAWTAASLIHLRKTEVKRALREVFDLVRPGGRLGATFAHGTASCVLERGWLPGRYFSRWTKGELAAAMTRAGWRIESLMTVTNRERKGRWLNLIASRPPGREDAASTSERDASAAVRPPEAGPQGARPRQPTSRGPRSPRSRTPAR